MKKGIAITLLSCVATAGALVPAGMAASSPAAAAQTPAQTEKPPQPKPKPPVKLSFAESVRRYLQRVGASVDDDRSKQDMIVSNYSDPKSRKVAIVIVEDPRKSLVGFYVYNFGSLKDAEDRREIDKYLLAANDEITVGAFFVDKDQDIGYKYFLRSEQLSLSTFESVYLTIAAVALDRRAEIRRILSAQVTKEDKL